MEIYLFWKEDRKDHLQAEDQRRNLAEKKDDVHKPCSSVVSLPGLEVFSSKSKHGASEKELSQVEYITPKGPQWFPLE